MDYTSLLWLVVVSFLTFISWKCSNLAFYLRWVAVYVILWWRRWSVDTRGLPIFCSKKEEYLEKPRIWRKEKPFSRDSMLLFAGGQDTWLLLELARGRHNSARARLCLQLTLNGPIYQTSDDGGSPRACDGWQTDSLSLQCLEPMRRWRIVFSGRLYSRSDKNNIDNKLVKINLIWAALDGPYHYGKDEDLSAVTTLLAEHPLTDLRHTLKMLAQGYEQWGMLLGTVNVASSVTNIHTPALRRHSWQHPRTTIVGVADDGTLFSISHAIRRQLGHIRYPDGRVETTVGTSLTETPSLRHKFVTSFSSSCLSHVAYVVRNPSSHWGGLSWAQATCTLDSQQATCLVLSWNKSIREDIPWLPVLEYSTAVCDDLVLTFDHPVCTNPAVVGGKAASLALLQDTARTILRNKVIIPAGFCVTVEAMRLQAQSSEALSSAVKFLTLISSGREVGHLQEECQHVVSAWLGVPLCHTLAAAISDRVTPGRSYAVRSSALNEDNADSSAAGQNSTILGCVGVDNIIVAILKCWASLYTFQSVQYRRQCGLPVESLMGVVVQEMVEAETAGVMFTRHLVTFDPAQLLITANYGLGESVVSGRAEPDTVTVNTGRPGHLRIDSVDLGTKGYKMVLTEGGGVEEAVLPEELSGSLCLSEPEVIALARVGLVLEQAFGWPADIEWAINKGVIHLLQCRPITSLLAWSDDELTHELDSAILPGDATTLANLGEVLPGATSPLCQSTSLRIIDFVMIRRFCGVKHHLWYNNNKVVQSHHHSLLHLYNTVMLDVKEEPGLAQKVLELAVCGHRVSTPEMQAAASRRATPTTLLQKVMSAAHMIWQVMVSKSGANKARMIGEQFQLNCDTFTSAHALYDYLTDSYSHMMEVLRLHSRVSFASTTWQMILFTVLAEGKSDLSEENIEDIARLLVGRQSAISLQIPKDVEELREVIKTCRKWPELMQLAPDKMAVWLQVNCPPASKMLADIVDRYRHRNVKELDVMTPTWGLDSRPLLAMVQTTLRTTQTHNLNEDNVHQLKSPQTQITRLLIRWLMGMSGEAAARRETTKDAVLRVTHQLRCGYHQLASLMCQEGRLPSPSLLWLCTHHELGLILQGPNPPLLRKIQHRRRSWKGWDELQFPEVMIGPPTPVQFGSHPSMVLEKGVQGTLVCPGIARGRACVLLSSSESSALRPGDILITRSTDVGWTPLFPLLAGVVTELGGLISHGAVVAREYGLPCVVGATNATVVFKTGDEIYLDGRSGKVLKVS